jgi:hypothetical protein
VSTRLWSLPTSTPLPLRSMCVAAPKLKPRAAKGVSARSKVMIVLGGAAAASLGGVGVYMYGEFAVVDGC